jgi:hypothetical protein
VAHKGAGHRGCRYDSICSGSFCDLQPWSVQVCIAGQWLLALVVRAAVAHKSYPRVQTHTVCLALIPRPFIS